MKEDKVIISFEGKSASFNINATDEQVLTALMGLEAYASEIFQLPVTELRSLVDETKVAHTVRNVQRS